MVHVAGENAIIQMDIHKNQQPTCKRHKYFIH